MLNQVWSIIENVRVSEDATGGFDPIGIKLDPFARELFAVPLVAAANRNYANYASWQF